MFLERKMETIESELKELKSVVWTLVQQPSYKKLIKLKGMLRGIQIHDRDIKESKNSLFKTGA